jgi:membrane fusion protein (multidrug efflux system)
VEASEGKIGTGGRKRVRKWAFRAAVAVALAATSVYLWPKIVYSFSHESTDDAYVQGTIIPVSPEVRGKVKAVLVEDNQPVRKGDPLLEIDGDEYARVVRAKQDALDRAIAAQKSLQAAMDEKSWELRQAEARLDGARADLDYATKEEARYKRLLKEESVSRSKYDRIGSERKVKEAEAEARRAEAMAARMAIRTLRAKLDEQKRAIEEARSLLELARIDLARTVIYAPASGNVTRKNVYPGNYVQPGQPLLAIVDPSEVWIVANFKETQVEKMRVGQPVDIRFRGFP